MKSEVMTLGNEKLKIYETVLSSPGMAEKCKIILQLSRQNILLLSRIIELGLEADKKEMNGDILMLLTEEGLEEFRKVLGEILSKGGLTDFYEKLKLL
jgi:hypothetical protein